MFRIKLHGGGHDQQTSEIQDLVTELRLPDPRDQKLVWHYAYNHEENGLHHYMAHVADGPLPKR